MPNAAYAWVRDRIRERISWLAWETAARQGWLIIEAGQRTRTLEDASSAEVPQTCSTSFKGKGGRRFR